MMTRPGAHRPSGIARPGMALWLLAAALAAGAACLAMPAATAQQPAPPLPASQLVAIEHESAGQLLHSAVSLEYDPKGTPARAGRLVACAEFARALERDDPQTNRLLLDIYRVQGRTAAAATAARAALDAQPNDCVLGMTWLELALQTQSTAADRMELLTAVAARQQFSPALRAEALTAIGQLQLGKGGDSKKADESFQAALKLDPSHARALEAVMALQAPPVGRRVGMMLEILRGDPQAIDVMWDLANTLDRLGIYGPARNLYGNVVTIMTRRGGEKNLPQALLAGQLNALLDGADAKQAATVVDKLLPVVKRFDQDVDLRSLLVEAYAMAGDKEAAVQQANALLDMLKDSERSSSKVSRAREMAHFFTFTQDKPFTAVAHAKRAIDDTPNDPVAQRLLACAQVRTTQPELLAEGIKKLQTLYETDAYAACCLAQALLDAGDKEQATKVLLAGAALGHSGPAYRRLVTLAAQAKVEIPPMEGAKEAQAALDAFNSAYLDMAATPEKHIAVTLALVGQPAAGEPIEVDVTIKNIGSIDVPLGREGLLSPAVALQAKVVGTGSAVTHLPMAVLPAPRFLPPGESIHQAVRLDVGSLEMLLARSPLRPVIMQIEATVDPEPLTADTTMSSVPTVKVEPLLVKRRTLFEYFGVATDDMPNAYESVLGLITRDLKQRGDGSEPARMRAAAQTAELLALEDSIAAGPGQAPAGLSGRITRPILLSMARAMLQDPSSLVRAQMLRGMQFSRVDETALSLVTPLAKDPQPLVRFRVAELLGPGLSDPRRASIVRALAADSDENVARMAKAFLPIAASRPTATAASRPGAASIPAD